MSSAFENALLVGAGGFVGALLRYGLAGWVHDRLPLATFPVGTLAVNLTGCLLIGAMTGLAESRNLFGPEVRVFALVGLLGGFTTFSTFGHETMAMLRDGEAVRAGTNVALHVVAGLVAVWLGYAVASARWTP